MIAIPHPFICFGILFAIVIISSWLMGREGKFFFTKDPVRRKFSMLEMEFPAKSYDLETLINGIYQLPDDKSKTIRSVKNQLLLDCFLFIPAIYGSIFLLCMTLANSFNVQLGRYWFMGIAWLQVVPLVLDYIENIYFRKMISKSDHYVPPPDPFKPVPVSRSFNNMKLLEKLKWGIPLFAFACWASVGAYFWVSGNL